jgi:hypothetical protein
MWSAVVCLVHVPSAGCGFTPVAVTHGFHCLLLLLLLAHGYLLRVCVCVCVSLPGHWRDDLQQQQSVLFPGKV